MSEPQGQRQEVVTYTIREKTGLVITRGSGLKTLEAAETRAAEWAREKDEPAIIERVTYVGYRHAERVDTILPPDPHPPVV